MPYALALGLLVMSTGSSPSFKEGVAAFHAGNFEAASKALLPVTTHSSANLDYALYFLAESQFYAGEFAKAEKTFAALGKLKTSRFAPQAPYRRADCQWMSGQHKIAATAYQALPKSAPDGVDPAVRLFRLSEFALEKASETPPQPTEIARAAQAFLSIHVDYPGHPLGVLAGAKAKTLAPAAEKAEGEPTPALRLDRAAKLSKSHQWKEAEEELAKLPTELSPEHAVERDYALGMAKYQSRSDYAGAANLLASAASRLSGERAAFAAFHGARSLSRLDRDDEAILRYRQVARDYPQSKWAIEAQFRYGWLDFNRGHFREAMPGLRESLRRFPSGAFADDAAWYLVLAHYLLDEFPAALESLDLYQRKTRTEDGDLRARYFRARIHQKMGQAAEAFRLYSACFSQAPFSYYGLLSRSRLEEAKQAIPVPPAPPPRRPLSVEKDPAIERASDLAQAGLDVEAGIELGRAEDQVIKRLGKARALPQLLHHYARFHAYRRAQKLAESNGSKTFGSHERLYLEALYPRAYADDVVKYTTANAMSELFLYAIMRKESGYYPFAVSSADARGLLQLIPSTAGDVAKSLGQPFFADQLFDPLRNITLGTGYLGGLLRRFSGQEALAAGGYNAGGKAMSRWCDQWGMRPFDEFIELITYDQAREYIKRVLAIYARYRHLYGEPLVLSLIVNPHYDKSGVK